MRYLLAASLQLATIALAAFFAPVLCVLAVLHEGCCFVNKVLEVIQLLLTTF
jgi:hypothetical protein